MQANLFDDEVVPNGSTAIYPNRMIDKTRVEAQRGLSEFGDSITKFHTSAGTLFAIGYVRVVYGDHGPYVEFEREHICTKLKRKFDRVVPPEAYYEWLEPIDGSEVKVYDQRRDVRNIRNAPRGGFAGNRSEGYADYKPGMIYVSPFELNTEKM